MSKSKSEVAQSCPALCDPMDCSLPGSSVQGIFQAIVLEWIAISFSRDLPNTGIEPGSPTLWAKLLPAEPPGKPRQWQPTSVLLPGESHGGRSLVGYSPWGRKESDMTEQLHFFTSIHL